MKRFLGMLLLLCLLAALPGCTAEGLEDMQWIEGEDGPSIVRGDSAYVFYGFVGGDRLTGRQIGVLDGDGDHKVFAVKGYADADWVLERLDTLMSGTTCSLFRRADLADIPEDFALDEESMFLHNYA